MVKKASQPERAAGGAREGGVSGAGGGGQGPISASLPAVSAEAVPITRTRVGGFRSREVCEMAAKRPSDHT